MHSRTNATTNHAHRECNYSCSDYDRCRFGPLAIEKEIIQHLGKQKFENPTAYLANLPKSVVFDDAAIRKAWRNLKRGVGIESPGDFFSRRLRYRNRKSWHTRSGRSFSLTGDKAMKRIDSMKHLEEYGVIPLTGESDAHMYRVLCDVTKRGKAIIERTLGIQITPAENWNSGGANDPHVGSFLLPQEFVSPLAVFCLLSSTMVTEVWLIPDKESTTDPSSQAPTSQAPAKPSETLSLF